MWSVFTNRVDPGERFITKQVYFDCIDDLLEYPQMPNPSSNEKVVVSRVFDTLFDAFDHENAGSWQIKAPFNI